MNSKLAYENAKAAHRAAERAANLADGRNAPPEEMARLNAEIQTALDARKAAFAAYMADESATADFSA